MTNKKNKEALAVVKQMVADRQIAKEVAEKYFPELAESEDEKIRKMIINTLNRDKILTEDEAYDCVDWIEKQGKHKHQYNSRPRYVREEELLGANKQGEQKPVEWSDKDDWRFSRVMRATRLSTDCNCEDEDWLKSLKDRCLPQPKQEWSEEDEQYLLVCKNALSKYQVTEKWDAGIISRWLETKLKSLRSQKQQNIDKACMYLNEHRDGFITDNYIKDFRKAFEEA